MKLEYRKVIENVELTKEEALTLFKARTILQQALENVLNAQCQYDKDLVESINKGIEGLNECNPRLNVNIIVGE